MGQGEKSLVGSQFFNKTMMTCMKMLPV